MDLKGCLFTELRNWYTSQSKVSVCWCHKEKNFEVLDIDKDMVITRTMGLMDGMEKAREYLVHEEETVKEHTAPEIRKFVELTQREVCIKLGQAGITSRQRSVLGLMLNVCEDALRKDRYLD